ncbi:hypothetical protein C2S51_009870 [Perilla frutescens var. frutescens]|nr:hypothetical protein C2S51_009870 [Perilla frutescens var. frutescens]
MADEYIRGLNNQLEVVKAVLLEQTNSQIDMRSAEAKEYINKIVDLTENAASKDARIRRLESELGRLRAANDRFVQEKENLEKRNSLLNEELTTKDNNLIQVRKEYGEYEADMSAKLEDVEHKLKESSNSLNFHKDRVRELEDKLLLIERELSSTKDAAAAAEETAIRLSDSYKESSEEWSKKVGELEGVNKALQTQLNQVESEYKDKLEKEVSARKEVEKELSSTKDALAAAERRSLAEISTETAGEAKHESWFVRLVDNPYMMAFLIVVGLVCAVCFPLYLTLTPSLILPVMIFTILAFICLSFYGLAFRDDNILRDTDRHHLAVTIMIIVLMTFFTIYVGVTFEANKRDIYGFTILTLYVFCLVQIVQPKSDYGLLQFFVSMPLQVTILHYRAFKIRFRIWYLLGVILPVFCLVCQAYLSSHFNTKKEDEEDQSGPDDPDSVL